MSSALILGITLATASPVAAQDRPSEARAEGLADAVAACRTITPDAERLACFDKAAGALLTARDAGDVVILDREGMRRAKRRVFGFQLPRLGLFGNGSEDEAKREPEVREIESTLTRVSSIGNGLYTFTLADGSTWQSIDARAGLFPKADQAIKIEAGILGSYVARIGGSSRTLKVKRVR